MEEIEQTLFPHGLESMVESLSYSRRLECVWKLITDAYPDAQLSLSDATRHCAISRSQLNAKLDENTGLSFHQLLTRYRLWNAIRMMTEKDYSIAELAVDNGFEDVLNFRRHFIKVFGIRPREFRRRLQQPEAGGGLILRKDLE